MASSFPPPRRSKFNALVSRLKPGQKQSHNASLHPTSTDSGLPSSLTFHSFLRLPFELQIRILQYCVDRTPRIFELGGDLIHNDVRLKHTKLKLDLPSCPLTRIPFPAAVTSALRCEMAKGYDRVEFSNAVVWMNLKTDTIFVSCMTDFRFTLNFGRLAKLNPWLSRIENLALSVDKYFELQVYASVHRASGRDYIGWWYDTTGPFQEFMQKCLLPRDLSESFKGSACDDFLRWRTRSLPSLFRSIPKVQKLKIIHQSSEFRWYAPGVLPGPLNFCRPRSSHSIREREQLASDILKEWQKSQYKMEQLQLEYFGLIRNGVYEEDTELLTIPYSTGRHRFSHMLRWNPCRCQSSHRWYSVNLPQGISQKPCDTNGPHLIDVCGKRISFHYNKHEKRGRWKLGSPNEYNELKQVWANREAS